MRKTNYHQIARLGHDIVFVESFESDREKRFPIFVAIKQTVPFSALGCILSIDILFAKWESAVAMQQLGKARRVTRKGSIADIRPKW